MDAWHLGVDAPAKPVHWPSLCLEHAWNSTAQKISKSEEKNRAEVVIANLKFAQETDKNKLFS
jgi:hypothetical protein